MSTETTQEGVSQPVVDATDALAQAWNQPLGQPLGAPEQPQAEPDPQPEAEPEKPAEAEEGQLAEEEQSKEAKEEEGEPITSLSDFLQTNELDPDAFSGLTATVKVDGKESQVPLRDIIKSYQLERHVNNKSIELSNQQKEHQARISEWNQAVQQQLQQHQAVAQYAQLLINQDYAGIDWNALKANDPVDYAVKAEEFRQRQAGLQQFLAQSQQLQQQAAQQAEQHRWANLANEQEAMMNAIPAWRDEQVLNKERGEIAKYLTQRGFNEGEIGNIYDHRLMVVARDAARYAALEASKPETTKRVREAPKMAKPGSRIGKDPSLERRKAAMQRLKANPTDHDAQAAAFDY